MSDDYAQLANDQDVEDAIDIQAIQARVVEAKRLAEAIAYNEVSYSSLVTARLGSLGRIADDVTALLAEVERLRDELLTRDMIWLPAKDAEIEWLTKEVNYLQECINKSHA